MSNSLSAQESVNTIGRFIQEVGGAEKRASALSEPGSQGGETTHPVKDVDDRLEVAQEGFRSDENTSDVKEDQGKPSVENAPLAKSEGTIKGSADRNKRADDSKSQSGAIQEGSAADDQLQIGPNKQPTGDDPAVETNSAKSGKEDPGSSHPARTDNDSLDGHKYSEDQLSRMGLGQLAKIAADLGNDLCASIAVEDPHQVANGHAKRASDNGQASEVSHQAGWELAGLMTGNFDKRAADQMVQNTLEEIIKTASDDADKVIHYLASYQQGRDQAAYEKQAMGEEMMGGDPMMMGGGGGGPPPEAMPPGGGMPMGAEEGGAEDMMGALGGGDPAGGDELGGGADPEAMQLAQVLEELGVTPEELEAAMAEQEGGGGEGEMMGGGSPGGMGGGDPAGMEVEGSDRRRGGGLHKRGNAKEGVREYITEVISRSRRSGK